MTRTICAAFMAAGIVMGLAGCATAPGTEEARAELHQDVMETVQTFRQTDPGMSEFFDNAHGWAVFPSVGKGGLVFGGAYGRGELFEQGSMVGHCDLTQATFGLQIGGQEFSEIVFFQNDEALENFKEGEFAFAAGLSAVAVEAGASSSANYTNGVAVFTFTRGGLMAEASIGGQSFSFESVATN